jgi:hypothetical protein
MSSSVSSERAFSQGGITITKLRSRLKGDIVEALQCLKCAIRNELFLQEPAPSSTLEVWEEDSMEVMIDVDGSDQTDTDSYSLDGLGIDDDDEELYASD